MWVVEEFTQIMKEMLLDGNIHNIVVFTVITSSSVLSVVGMLRHIYTFIYKLRHEQEANQPPVKEFCAKEEESCSQTLSHLGGFPIVASLERFAILNVDFKKYNSRNRGCSKGGESLSDRNSKSPTCLKCDKAMWERFCVYGLCQPCCQRLGGCQSQGHKKQPVAYNPWSNNWHRSERIIDLSHLCLHELPPRLGFYHMDGRSLDVSYNRLTSLPEHVTLMRSLVILNLRHNLLANIPAFITSLHQLAFIDLRNNKLSTFPAPLLELTQLLKLNLDHNFMCTLPNNIDKLHFLQCLSLGYNDLTSIPDSLFNIRGLKSLNLRGNNKLSVLPISVGNLVCLQRLDVSRCDLRLIPASLSLCTVLKKCNASHNRITQLPCEISQCYRLIQLDVSHNRLSFFPATLLFRQGMLTLSASGNNFVPRPNVKSHWFLLDNFTIPDRTQVPTLFSLSGAVIEKFSLDSTRLPLPIQEDLSSISSCYHCGKKKFINSLRAINFTYFVQRHLQAPHQQLVQKYPFLFTFCRKHVHACTMDTLEVSLDSLSGTHEYNNNE